MNRIFGRKYRNNNNNSIKINNLFVFCHKYILKFKLSDKYWSINAYGRIFITTIGW